MNIFSVYGQIDDQHRQSSGFYNDGGPADNGRRSVFYYASDLEGRSIKSRTWLVQDLVPLGTVTLLGGDGGTGKSLLALQLAAAVATESRWLGYPTAGGSVLFISAEDDDDELHRRTDDILKATGATFRQLDRLILRSLAGEDALLATLDRSTGVLQPTQLYKEIEERVAEEKPSLIVLDTLADLFPGNENDRAQARQFIGMLRGWAIRHKCAVLLLAHPSLSGMSSGSGTSGSTGWNNSVRSRLYLERVLEQDYEANPDARKLTTKKANYGRTGGEIAMTWKDGVFVPDAQESGLDRMAATAKAERVFLKLLRLFSEQGRKVNHAGGPTYAPNLFAGHPGSEGMTKRPLRAAMETLLTEGKIRVAQDGPASKRRSFLEVVE